SEIVGGAVGTDEHARSTVLAKLPSRSGVGVFRNRRRRLRGRHEIFRRDAGKIREDLRVALGVRAFATEKKKSSSPVLAASKQALEIDFDRRKPVVGQSHRLSKCSEFRKTNCVVSGAQNRLGTKEKLI